MCAIAKRLVMRFTAAAQQLPIARLVGKAVRRLAGSREVLVLGSLADEEIPLAEDDASGYMLPDLGGINLAGFED